MSCSVSGGIVVDAFERPLPLSSTGTEPIGTDAIGLDCSVVVDGCWTTRSKSASSAMWLSRNSVFVPGVDGIATRNTSSSPLDATWTIASWFGARTAAVAGSSLGSQFCRVRTGASSFAFRVVPPAVTVAEAVLTPSV
jgi:hypothetical protein